MAERLSLRDVGPEIDPELLVAGATSLISKLEQQLSLPGPEDGEEPPSPLTPRSTRICRELLWDGAVTEFEDVELGDDLAALALRASAWAESRAEAHAMGSPRLGTALRSGLVDGPPGSIAEKVRRLYGEAPGKFLQSADGITHFVTEGSGSRLAVVAHGLTDSMRSYGEVSRALVESGFKVVRYDLLGHGWSYMRQGLVCDLDVLLLQLRQLLDHLLKPGENVDLFVGHSTGAVVGVAAARKMPELDGRRVDRLGLISPAFWKSMPDGVAGVAATLSEKAPALTRSFVTYRLARWLLFDMLCDAFAREFDDSTGEVLWLHPSESENYIKDVCEAFEAHPFLFDSCMGINTTVLTDSVMTESMEMFKSVVAAAGVGEVSIGLFWGTHDTIVDFDHSDEVLSWPGGGALSLVPLERLGHASPTEDGARVGAEIAGWLGKLQATAIQ